MRFPTTRMRTAGLALGATVLMALPALAQQGPGPGNGPGPGGGFGPRHGFGGAMMGGGWHHGHGGFLMHGAVGVFALIGIVAVILAVVRAFRGRCWHHRHGHGRGAGLDILETRYAKSEIGRDEYLEKKRDLGGRP